MSESIRRKSSSRQLLQNLIRVTAQRSQEDAEEVERERRRRTREKQRGEGSPSWPEPPPEPPHDDLPHNRELDEELKPTCRLVLEEDEGFSDWSHRLENRNDQEVPVACRARVQRSLPPQWKPEPEVEKQQEKEEEEGCTPEQSSPSQEAQRPTQKMSSNRKEIRTSYSSTVFLPQDVRLPDRTSYLVAGTMKPRGGARRVDGGVKHDEQKEEMEVQPDLQREWRSAGAPRSHRDEDEEEEEEELSFTHEGKEDFHFGQEERHKEEEEEDQEDQEEEKMPDEHLLFASVPEIPQITQPGWPCELKKVFNHERSAEGRRSEEMSRRSAESVCSSEGDEALNCYGPMSPTFKKLLIQFYPDEANSRVSTDVKCKIIERTESLKKSTSCTKKTPPPLPVSKINKKLEQYTHALEVSSKEGRPSVQVLTDLTSPAEPVSSKKNLFEAGEAWNQSSVSVTPSKQDADGLKVGVADLINQWVKGGEDASRCSSPFRPAEGSAGKRYKFVVTGHGKYEKVSVDHDSGEDANCPSAGQFYEDL
uniref:Lymphocyte-specific protein 1-like n=1 Tax=Labrus bergylta TaxID=56723 RepID=A0A3Q3GUA9_9LABR|nr:lymphocyte-specific protein 1-like isoform X1 [Labrus bergylta]